LICVVILYVAIGLLAVLVSVMAVNTRRRKPQPNNTAPFEPLALDENRLALNLSGMIRIKTVTTANERDVAREAFLSFHEYLEKTYPLAHKTLEKETVNTYSLLYRWPGKDPEKKPCMLTAHMDVVPVAESTLHKWEYPPFSGEIANGYVWGRGGLDCKGQLANIMESVEYLLADGFTPERDIYIAMGHDEESMGDMGARMIADLLHERGVRLEFVLDEGGTLMNGAEIGVGGLIAAVGIAEKRCMYIRLVAESPGGHAAMPPRRTAVGDVARAIAALEKRPFRCVLNETLRHMLECIGGHMKFPFNVLMSNIWLTKPLLLKGFSMIPAGAAMMRTTMAPTMMKGSSAMNALAEKAEAIVSVRLLPGQSVEETLARIKDIAGKRVKVEMVRAHGSSGVSSVSSDAYRLIKRTIEGMFGGCIVMPYLTLPATDSRWYEKVADDIYRFEPHKSLMDDGMTIHATGERLRFDSLREGTEFFIRLIRSA